MFQNLTGWHALIILAVILLLFGAAKLPALARSVGQSMRILKTEATDAASASEEHHVLTEAEQQATASPVRQDATPLSQPTSP